MAHSYRPSNGTEGMYFMAQFCDHCTKCPMDPDADGQCDILGRSFAYQVDEPEYPKEWIVDDDGLSNPRCTAFEPRNKCSNSAPT